MKLSGTQLHKLLREFRSSKKEWGSPFNPSPLYIEADLDPPPRRIKLAERGGMFMYPTMVVKTNPEMTEVLSIRFVPQDDEEELGPDEYKSVGNPLMEYGGPLLAESIRLCIPVQVNLTKETFFGNRGIRFSCGEYGADSYIRIPKEDRDDEED